MMYLLHALIISVIGMFYYTIGNLRPELRSTQRAIQLIACATAPNIKRYGFETILKPFIDDIKSLAEVMIKFSVANNYNKYVCMNFRRLE